MNLKLSIDINSPFDSVVENNYLRMRKSLKEIKCHIFPIQKLNGKPS